MADGRAADVFDWRGVADPGGMVIDQVFLEVFDLFIVEHHFREFSDTGVDAIHDLMRGNLLLEHGTAGLDAG